MAHNCNYCPLQRILKIRRRDTESSQATSMEWDHGGEDLRGVSDDYTLFSENEEIEVTARRYEVLLSYLSKNCPLNMYYKITRFLPT